MRERRRLVTAGLGERADDGSIARTDRPTDRMSCLLQRAVRPEHLDIAASSATKRGIQPRRDRGPTAAPVTKLVPYRTTSTSQGA